MGGKSAIGIYRYAPLLGSFSVSAGWRDGRLLTRPLIFDSEMLRLNFSTSAAGAIHVEIQDVDGQPIQGFTREDCDPIFGDSVSRSVTWKSEANVSALMGKPVQLLFELQDADLYSFRLAPAAE